MKNIYFPDEDVTDNDLYFICYMIERVARKLHRRNKYVVHSIGKKNLTHLISVANVLHCENPLKVEDEWIADYELERGDFDITDVDSSLCNEIPATTSIGKVYTRLILAVNDDSENEDWIDTLIKVYDSPICETIDNYNASAYYEPSYVITRAFWNGQF